MASTKISVGVRIRPVKPNSGFMPISLSKEVKAITVNDQGGRCVAQYPFDSVYGPTETTDVVYQTLAKDIVLNAVKGFNGTIFAYGQTASGKTHTMIGTPENPGIVRLALGDIFDSIQNTPDRVFLLRLSILDIYNEQLTDLLEPNARKLHIRENNDGAVFVENLSEEICTCPEDFIRFLNDGLARRHVGATNMNEYSSRSHSICRLIIESRPKAEDGVVNVSQLNFVDLAGSERVSQTGASGERLKEGQAINKSLFTLTLVITKLSEGSCHVNFRDSKLTRILQNALGGNSLTAIVCTVSPLIQFYEQTLSTIKFATSANNIQTKPMLNENVSNEAMMKRMQQEIADLKAKIAQFECAEGDREMAKVELAEKEQLFRGAICFSTRGVEEPKQPKRFRRLTWAPRDRCNFALTITDDDSVRNVGPSSAIKRDLESILGRGTVDDSSVTAEQLKKSSPIGYSSSKRCRRREVIFSLPTDEPIAENVEGEQAAEQDLSSEEETGPSTGILVDIVESPVRRSVATSPVAWLDESVDKSEAPGTDEKSTQIDNELQCGDDLFSFGRELFLENSMAHFEAREEIVKLECDVRNLANENICLKRALTEAEETAKTTAQKPATPPPAIQLTTTCGDECQRIKDEAAELNCRYDSLKRKYDQVVEVLESERDVEKAVEVEELKKKLQMVEEENARLVEQLSENERLKDFEAKFNETEKQLAEQIELVEGLKTSKNSLDAEICSLRNQFEEKSNLVEELHSAKALMEGLIEEKSQLVGQLEAEVEELKISKNQFFNNQSQFEEKLRTLEGVVEELTASKAALESLLGEQSVSYDELKTSKEELESEFSSVRRQFEEQSNLLQSLEAIVEELKTSKGSVENDVSKAKELLNEKLNMIDELKTSKQSLESELSSVQSFAEEKAALVERLEAETQSLKSSNTVMEENVRSHVDELKKSKNALEAEVSRLQGLLDEQLELAETLKASKQSLDDELSSVRSLLEEKLLLIEKLEAEAEDLKSSKALLEEDVESQFNELKTAKNSAETEALRLQDMLDENSNLLESLKSEKLLLENELFTSRNTLEKLESDFEEVKASKALLESNIRSVQSLLDEKSNTVEMLEAKMKEMEADLETDQSSVENRDSSEANEMKNYVETLEKEKESLESQLIDAINGSEKLRQDGEKLKNEIEVCLANVDALNEDNMSINLKLAEKSEELENSKMEVAELKKECADKVEDIQLMREEIDSLFEKNVALKKRSSELESELSKLQEQFDGNQSIVQLARSDVEEKSCVISRLQSDLDLLRQQVNVAECERQMYLTELNEAGRGAAKAKVELEELKAMISTQTAEAACNTSLLASRDSTARTACNTPNFGVSPTRKSRLSAVLPAFSSSLEEKVTPNSLAILETESVMTTPAVPFGISPALSSPFSASTIGRQDQITPSKPRTMEMCTQTVEEAFENTITRIEISSEFHEKYVARVEMEKAVSSYHETVGLWDKMRSKLEGENARLRERIDRLSDAIGRLIEGKQLSPLPTPQNVSEIEKTTLVAVGGDVTMSASTCDENIDGMLNRLRTALKEKDDNARTALSNERDSWAESAKEFEEEIAKMNKQVLQLEHMVGEKEGELKQMTLKIEQFGAESFIHQQTVTELRENLAAKTDSLRHLETELVEAKRGIDDRQAEIKRLQFELGRATASLVVADEGQKTTERGFASLQKAVGDEQAQRRAAEELLQDCQVKLSMSRSDADSWREKANKLEDDVVCLNSEVSRLQAVFEAAEEQVASLTHRNAGLAKSLEDSDVIVAQANDERDSALKRLDQVEGDRDRLATELQSAQQEVTKQQLLVDSLTKSVDTSEVKLEKARGLFYRLREERNAAFSRIEQLKEDKKKAVEVIEALKKEREVLENLVRESAEKCSVLESRHEDVRQERDTLVQGLQASRGQIRQMREESVESERQFARRLKELGQAWRQCLANAGMPVSEQTVTDPQQLVREVKWTSKHSVVKLNVMHALQGLGITCDWLHNESYERISELEASRRTILARDLENSRVVEQLKTDMVKLRTALSGCRCRSNKQHAQLLQLTEETLTALNRKPLADANSGQDVRESKENASAAEIASEKKASDNFENVSMEMSP